MAKFTDLIKNLTEEKLSEQVMVTCYSDTEILTRRDALDKYFECTIMCQGCEAERYFNILIQLIEGHIQCYDL